MTPRSRWALLAALLLLVVLGVTMTFGVTTSPAPQLRAERTAVVNTQQQLELLDAAKTLEQKLASLPTGNDIKSQHAAMIDEVSALRQEVRTMQSNGQSQHAELRGQLQALKPELLVPAKATTAKVPMKCSQRHAKLVNTIGVYVPNFHNAELAIVNLQLLQSRACDPERVKFYVVTMEETALERKQAAEAITKAVPNAIVMELVTDGLVGGAVLPPLFRFILTEARMDLTIFADTDALMLAEAWDARLDELFDDEKLALAAINPRTSTRDFHCLPEWNWMVLRTRLYKLPDHPFKLQMGASDWGQSFAWHATDLGYKQYRWADSASLGTKSGRVVGDSADEFWVFHSFYGSRGREDVKEGHPEHQWVPTEENKHTFEDFARDPQGLRDLVGPMAKEQGECPPPTVPDTIDQSKALTFQF